VIANAFSGKSGKPTAAELRAALGPARALWDDVVRGLAEDVDVADQEWGSSSVKAGWSLRLMRKGRVIVYLAPGQGVFLASFALGDKAVKEALASPLPASVIKLIKEAKRYAEGTGVRIEVRSAGDVEAVKLLAAIKQKN